MSEYIFYTPTVKLKPQNISVKTDQYFYTHHNRNEEDFQKLVLLAKLIPEIRKKKALDLPLNAEEQYANMIFLEDKDMLINRELNGSITATDGRHRLLALKKANVEITKQVTAYFVSEPLREINDIFEKRKLFVFGKKNLVIKPDIKYLVLETSVKKASQILKRKYGIIPIHDPYHKKDYVVISTEQIDNASIFEEIMQNMQKHNINISYTKNDILERG